MTKDRIKGIIIGITLVAGLNMVGATWSNPTVAPTGGNPDAPLNVGSIMQTKAGGLIIGGITTAAGGLIIENRTSDPQPADLINGRIWLRTDL